MGRKDNTDAAGQCRACPPSAGRTAADVAIIVAVVAVVVAVSAHAPTNLYAYAQMKRIGTAISMLTTGDWLLPTNQTGGIASKPQLYPWLTAVVLSVTGAYNDFVFRLPTVVATVATALLVYGLGRRWHGRRVGLLAACLWATAMHMSKMAYLAATDMLLTVFVTAAILCADRLLFHRAPRAQRWKWALGFWASMVLGALSKGWGVVNLALVGGALALAAGLGPGFGPMRRVDGRGLKALLAGRLVLRRLGRAMRAVRFGWGLAGLAAVLVPLWVGMFLHGGEEFRRLIYFEFVQRITGAGAHAPKASSAPAALHLLWYLLPTSVFAVGALVLVRPRRWFSREGPVWLPLCWTIAVLLPFSLTHGFRPDYLLPCYGAGAIMGAWAVEAVQRAGRTGGRAVGALRHVFAAAAIVISLAVGVIAAACMLRGSLGGTVAKALRLPAEVAPETWWFVGILIAVGFGGVVLATVWSLQWRIRRVAAVAMIATVGVMLLHTHLLSRHARTGDGETMLDFARRVRPIVGRDPIVVFRTADLSVELYLGRLGVRTANVADIDRSTPRWLITCDRGLAELGACREDPDGPYAMEAVEQAAQGPRSRKLRLRMLTSELGVLRATSRPVVSQNWGRIHLIELRRPVHVSGRPMHSVWVSGKADGQDDEDD